MTVEQAQKEAERCLECGCREYFKCKLLNVAQRYEIHPERFAGEMPQKYTKDSNSFIEKILLNVFFAAFAFALAVKSSS